MGRMGSFDLGNLKKLQERLNKVAENDIDDFLDACAKELASRLLAKVIKRTPVGQYPKSSGKTGGTLRHGWTTSQAGSGSEGFRSRNARQFVNSLPVHHFNGYIIIEIINPVKYASYVEFGHRTADHADWIPGKFMMTIAEQELSEIAPRVLKARIKKFLGECLNK